MTLCFPDQEKSCFSCCPPIRPAGYEHIQHRNIIRRVLRENSDAFKRHPEDKIPITGFSCWALGYLDKNHRLIGCLLHPAQNGGVDLRYRTDYGEKCEREFCPEAKAFSGLSSDEKEFWLRLADGLDSFSYSSRGLNPLFEMMNWGGHLLSLIASNENHRTFTKESFFQTYPFFSTNYPPRPNAYLINWLVDREGTHILKSKSFRSKFEAFSGRITKALCQAAQQNNSSQPLDYHTHLLDLDSDFLNLLRLSARITKSTRQNALALKDLVDRALEEFRQSVERI
ncbi:MAG: hypothetical protein PVJ69_17945 [Desulfobacteraceae bacterium]